jgi:predicted lipoprotein
MDTGPRINMLNARRGLSLAAVVGALVVCLAACAGVPGIYTYEDKRQAAKAAAGFDAKTYVDKIWTSKVLPTIDTKAVDAAILIAAIKAGPEAATKQYGKTSGTGAAPAFLIKGEGKVTAVDTSSPVGPVTVTLAGKAAGATITLVTGPVIAGTAIRDGVGFIDFSQFTNQIDYANVATQLNRHVKSDVVAAVHRASLTGKTVTFEGAFSLLTPDAISVVPTQLKVAQ